MGCTAEGVHQMLGYTVSSSMMICDWTPRLLTPGSLVLRKWILEKNLTVTICLNLFRLFTYIENMVGVYVVSC